MQNPVFEHSNTLSFVLLACLMLYINGKQFSGCVLILFSIYEPQHMISNNVVAGTSKGSDQPAHTRSLIRAFASRLNIV